jgi:site-specific DNA recombinase
MVEDLKGLLDDSPLSEQKAFTRSFIKEVKVMGEEATLIYTIPLLPDGLDHETIGVLDTVQYGGAGGIRTLYLLTASQTLSRLSYSPRPHQV